MGVHYPLYSTPVSRELYLKWVTAFRGPTEFHAVADAKLFAKVHNGKGMEKKVRATKN